MSVNKVNSDGSLSRVAGGTLYADAPIGTISPFGGSTIPSGYLLCNGAEVLKTAYAELYAVIGDAFGTASANTKFKLPDLREATTKGVGLSGKSNNHYDSDGVALGEFVEDRVQNGINALTVNSDTEIGFTIGTYYSEPGIGVETMRSGNTTEVKAVGVNYIIKAKHVDAPADFIDAVDEAVEEAIAELETVSTMTVTKQGNYINGTNFHGKKVGKVATIEINGDSGSSIPWEQITTVGIAIGSATPLTELKCTADMLNVVTGYDQNGNAIVRHVLPYCRAWIGANGEIQVFLANPGASDTSYTGNVFIGGSYITQ